MQSSTMTRTTTLTTTTFKEEDEESEVPEVVATTTLTDMHVTLKENMGTPAHDVALDLGEDPAQE